MHLDFTILLKQSQKLVIEIIFRRKSIAQLASLGYKRVLSRLYIFCGVQSLKA